MSKAFDEIAQEATQLSPEKRLELASLLLELNESSAGIEASAAWEEEILARIRAVDENQIEGVSFEAVMREAEDRRKVLCLRGGQVWLAPDAAGRLLPRGHL